MATKEKFDYKYSKPNFIVRKLTDNFFLSIKGTISGIEAKKILEVGAGPGFSTKYLKRFSGNRDFEASEHNEELAEEARKRNPDVRIQQESIYSLQRESGSFDLVIALEVLEHLQNPETALKELRRVSSKYCLISVPQEPLWRIMNICRLKYLSHFGNTPGHLNHWSKNQFAELIGKYFKIKKIKLSFPWIIVLAEK